jgi:purine nucleosidase
MLVALGPLTNLALALKLDPTLPQRMARLVVMGGAVTAHGNITPGGRIQHRLRSGSGAHRVLRIRACRPGRLGSHAGPRPAAADVERWLQADSARAFYRAISEKTRLWSADRRGDHWHSADALAMAWALNRKGP